jgi:transcriptional regulator with XRE-family HTH domain
LIQQDLATRIGTTASVISRLEDADYSGHSLAMLRRIAAALGRRVEIQFPTVREATQDEESRSLITLENRQLLEVTPAFERANQIGVLASR